MKLRNTLTFTFLIIFQFMVQEMGAKPQKYSDILNYRVKRDAVGPCVSNVCPTGYHCEEQDYVCLPGASIVDHTEKPDDSNGNEDNGNDESEKSIDTKKKSDNASE
ncbi:hypothetical protein DdX_15412 [Ditylenchus destructor]|uniref:Uncharacterized protein n=1 Tax=Ditylenchus destructor TaxID=166010 RepID=A0AAD4MSA3_9BILA|nr:hypothetical protein DdX_15412 [Ditylenchus destructor]